MTISAGLGLDISPFSCASEFWRWVDLCDTGGVDSIWQSDQIIGAEPTLECMSVMAALAGGSKRLRFGMNVASMALRDPVLTAKACATIDMLSHGRLLPAFGVGIASSPDFPATGTSTKGRGKRTNEGLEIMSKLWAQEMVSFEGEHFRLEAASIAPRSVQNPLPLWVGGSAAQAIERTARWGTGWQAGLESPEEIASVIRAIKARVSELGRCIDEDHYGAGFGFRLGSPNDPLVTRSNELLAKRLGRPPEDFAVAGDSSVIISRIKELHAVGVHKFVLRPVAHDGEDFIAQTRLFIEQLLPEVAALNH